MALTSIDTAFTQYDANLVYETDATGAKAILFLEAVRYLRGHRPQASAINGRSISNFDLVELEKAAVLFLDKKTTAYTARSSFTRGRMSVP